MNDLIKYAMVTVMKVGATSLGLFLLSDILGLPAWISGLIVGGITFFAGYYAMKRSGFNKEARV